MDPDEFSNTYLTKLINSTTNSKKPIILTGDFNFNLLKYGKHFFFFFFFFIFVKIKVTSTHHNKMKSIRNMDINKHINKTQQGNIYQPIPPKSLCNHNLFRFTFQKLVYAINHSTN